MISMLTTRESINYQFSLIFGYASPKDDELIVGDVIGPGKLTRNKVKQLSNEVMKFLKMYNAMLRDYTGSEVFSIEFSLNNIDEKDAQINIYPKSMIFIPGNYRECESLLLALKPETGILDTHKSREELVNISKLFFEVEEFVDHPELKKEEKEKVMNKFASRFNMKLFGELIEDKWNKKLIGLSTYLPTEKEMLNTYGEIKSKLEILLFKSPFETLFLNPEFEKIKLPFSGKASIDHLKFSISEPSANFVIENTLKLGTNLINLANTGTIDESKYEILSYLISDIERNIKEIKEVYTAEQLILKVNTILNQIEFFFNKFFDFSKNYLNTGNVGNLSELLTKFNNFIEEKGKLENINFSELTKLLNISVKNTIMKSEKLRAIELESVFYYFSEIFKGSIKLIRAAIPKYLSIRCLKVLILEFIRELSTEFEKEKKPVKILGQKYLNEFKNFLFNQIEINPTILSKAIKFNENNLIKEFINLIKSNYQLFLDNIQLNISDVVSFAEILMEKDSNIIKNHVEKFKKFPNELEFLLSYILRFSTINRYLKDEPNEEISDPVTFVNRFHRFLEKRIGGINLIWKTYVLKWITDYSKKFFKSDDQKKWELIEIYSDFIKYLENRTSYEIKPENFLQYLDVYISEISNESEKNHLLEFFKQYEFCISIRDDFLKYIKNKIEEKLSMDKKDLEKLVPINFFSIEKSDLFYNYLIERELKYFSKLIPRPITLILKHNLPNEEKDLFNSDFFHVFSFKYWGKDRVKIEISDNFKQIYREWVKEI